MRATNEEHEFVYSVDPDGNLEHVVLNGVQLDWNDCDLDKLSRDYAYRKRQQSGYSWHPQPEKNPNFSLI